MISHLNFNLQKVNCYFDGGYAETRVCLLNELLAGHKVPAPAIIIDSHWYYCI